MVDIDKQIEVAKKKPLTAENLNYIGDLYIKKSDRQRAVAYYYEAVDKLHFAQKEKKIAIYKKIINILPSSEKAYLSLVEILSKMGLVMEEKKYLHKLAVIYKEKGDDIKAEDLFGKIRELDPHVSIPGTFFHQQEYHETKSGSPAVHETVSAYDNVSEAPLEESRKLIDATLEEIHEDLPELNRSPEIIGLPRKKLYAAFAVISVVLLFFIVYFLMSTKKQTSEVKVFGPVSVVRNDFEITIKKLDDMAYLKDIVGDTALYESDIYILTVKSLKNCIPEVFASSPHNMIMLLDENGMPVKPVQPEKLRNATKIIYKMNTCGKEEAAVFEKILLAFDKRKTYKGIVLDGLDSNGPLSIGGESR